MPYINCITNIKIENIKEFQKEITELITCIPGKSVEVTMCRIDDEQRLFFKGNDLPCAMVEALVNQTTDISTTKQFSERVIELICSTLNIPNDRIYVTVDPVVKWHTCRK